MGEDLYFLFQYGQLANPKGNPQEKVTPLIKAVPAGTGRCPINNFKARVPELLCALAVPWYGHTQLLASFIKEWSIRKLPPRPGTLMEVLKIAITTCKDAGVATNRKEGEEMRDILGKPSLEKAQPHSCCQYLSLDSADSCASLRSDERQG